MEAYDPEIDKDMEDHKRRIREAKWTTKMADVSKYQGVCEVLVNRIVGAVDQHYIKELEDRIARAHHAQSQKDSHGDGVS